MNEFKTYHPIVNFVYFVFVIGFSCFFMHPVCLVISLVSGFSYSVMLKGRKATSYPGFEDALEGATYVYNEVAVDDFVITSRGMGTAIAFSLALVEKLVDAKKAEELGKSIIYQCS